MTRTRKRLGYIRVSTHDQNPARQIDGLKGATDALYIEQGKSACAARRPVYEEVIAALQPGDTLVVWDLDRAYRSVIDALSEVHKLKAQGIGFEAMSGDFDLSTPEGGFIFTLHAALSELERRKLGKRTKEGLAAARARGVKLGRPRKLTESDVQLAKAAIQIGGLTRKSVAAQLGVSTRTLTRALRPKARLMGMFSHIADSKTPLLSG